MAITWFTEGLYLSNRAYLSKSHAAVYRAVQEGLNTRLALIKQGGFKYEDVVRVTEELVRQGIFSAERGPRQTLYGPPPLYFRALVLPMPVTSAPT